LFNLHGDVIQLVDKNGKTVSMYEYDAFGREKNTAGQDKNYDNNPFRYCEEYNDLETNTIYLRNRYYSPSFGLFTFEDSAGAGNNWYVYCNNNPIYYIDSNGLDPTPAWAQRINAYIGTDADYQQARNVINK